MTPCVETTWSRNEKGYGRASRDGRRILAHRYAWEQAHGPVPVGLFVLHACDNPPCVNVEHLFLGTYADNNADRDAKGRTQRGHRHVHARLTEPDVVDIRRRHAAGETYTTIGHDYGMDHSGIRRAVIGENWRHVAFQPAPAEDAEPDPTAPLR